MNQLDGEPSPSVLFQALGDPPPSHSLRRVKCGRSNFKLITVQLLLYSLGDFGVESLLWLGFRFINTPESSDDSGRFSYPEFFPNPVGAKNA